MFSWKYKLTTISFIVFTFGCGQILDTAPVEAKVMEFRRSICEKNYDDVVLGASKAFQASINRDSFRTGIAPFAPAICDSDNFDISYREIGADPVYGKMITLKYSSKGIGNIAAEEYVYIFEDGQWRLCNYRFDEAPTTK